MPELVKMAYIVPVFNALLEDALSIRWYVWGTSGDARLDARYAAEDAAYRQPVQSWEGEGGTVR